MKKLTQLFIRKQLRYNRYFYRRLKDIIQQRDWSYDTLRALQEEKLLTLVREAHQQSPFYQQLYRNVDINKIKSPDDLRRLPVLTKKEVRAHWKEIFIGSRWNKTVAHTSGTTGSPMRLYRDYQSIVEENAYLWAHRIAHGHEIGMRTVTLRGDLDRDKMELFDPFTNTLQLSSYNLREDQAEWYYHTIQKFAPNAILAYPSSMETLANYLTKMGKTLDIPMVFTSSESLYSHQREKIEYAFNTRISDWYGNAERTIALEQRRDGSYDEFPLYSYNEYQEDHAITTSLINTSFPLIRYRVDDVFVTAPETADGHTRIDTIKGRSNDFLILPDGTRVGLLCCAFKGVNHLRYAQIVQENTQRFSINVVAEEKFSREDEAHLRGNVVNRIGKSLAFDIRYVNERQIKRSKAGKFKLILSSVASISEEAPPAAYRSGIKKAPNIRGF